MTRPDHFLPDAADLGSLTDLYQLTMSAGYDHHGIDDPCTFELFVRALPTDRGYLVAAGLEQAIAYLGELRFAGRTIDALRRQPAFAGVRSTFFERLADLRFTGSVRAVPEGTIVFAGEPLLSVRAPAIEAQLVETYLLSTIGFQTLIATKASRIVEAAAGRSVIDFGARRAHGPQAAMLASRASLIGGCDGTSNVMAGLRLGARLVGTAAHSWTMMFETETAAFAAYHEVFPGSSLLLVDTYDTLEGTRRAIAVAGPDLRGIRLDSGDLGALAVAARRILDEAGLTGARIVASGDLNEDRIAELLAGGAPIDLFGVGTEMVTSRDEPALGVVYKLVAVERGGRLEPRVKTSPGKATHPLPKQVHRVSGPDGRYVEDVVTALDETVDGGEPLLVEVVADGRPVGDLPDLSAIQERLAATRGRFDPAVRRHRAPAAYPVRFSDRLEAARAAEAARHGQGAR